jgi:hypothetical protein
MFALDSGLELPVIDDNHIVRKNDFTNGFAIAVDQPLKRCEDGLFVELDGLFDVSNFIEIGFAEAVPSESWEYCRLEYENRQKITW